MNFNTDEKIVLNDMVINQNIESLTIESLKESLAFSLIVTDDEMKPLMEGLLKKIDEGNIDQFNQVKLVMPFDVPYDLATNIDAVPFNESE